jgi:hypothetical protein
MCSTAKWMTLTLGVLLPTERTVHLRHNLLQGKLTCEWNVHLIGFVSVPVSPCLPNPLGVLAPTPGRSSGGGNGKELSIYNIIWRWWASHNLGFSVAITYNFGHLVSQLLAKPTNQTCLRALTYLRFDVSLPKHMISWFGYNNNQLFPWSTWGTSGRTHWCMYYMFWNHVYVHATNKHTYGGKS